MAARNLASMRSCRGVKATGLGREVGGVTRRLPTIWGHRGRCLLTASPSMRTRVPTFGQTFPNKVGPCQINVSTSYSFRRKHPLEILAC